MATANPTIIEPTLEVLPQGSHTHRRNQTFDLLRIVFATFVLLAHAPENTRGADGRELLRRLLHTDFNFGALGVDGFFLLSGYLIVQSWQHDPHLLNYLRKRVLRIVPGYLVAAILCTLAAGVFAPAVDHFFRHLAPLRFVASILMLGGINAPPVYPGAASHAVNGSLWTIPYEFRCYLLVAACGMLGFFRRPFLWVAFTCVLLVAFVFPVLTGPVNAWHTAYYITGQPPQIARLGSAFLIGGCFWVLRSRIAFRPLYAALAAAGLILVSAFTPAHVELAVCTLGAYLVFYLGKANPLRFGRLNTFPDISYGVYLYGTPVECLWISAHPTGSPWIAFLVGVCVSYPLGWLSWRAVERPMLRLKRRATAVLPPA